MAIPSFKDTLTRTLGPDISIVSDGSYFDDEENIHDLDITKMNQELSSTPTSDRITFMSSEQPKEDLSFQFFLKTGKK